MHCTPAPTSAIYCTVCESSQRARRGRMLKREKPQECMHPCSHASTTSNVHHLFFLSEPSVPEMHPFIYTHCASLVSYLEQTEASERWEYLGIVMIPLLQTIIIQIILPNAFITCRGQRIWKKKKKSWGCASESGLVAHKCIREAAHWLQQKTIKWKSLELCTYLQKPANVSTATTVPVQMQ